MKLFIHQWVNGSMNTLTNIMLRGLRHPNYNTMNNLTLKAIRKYIWLTHKYFLAYDRSLDIVAADEWLKQRRSHWGYIGQMDVESEKLHFPCGSVTAEEEAEVDNIEEYDGVIEIMLMLGVLADVETVEASAEYIHGDEDDEEEYDKVNYDAIDGNRTC